eukprot:scaffold2419_cov114-Isochrysis_galbana.AAC.2
MFATVHTAGSSLLGLFSSCKTFDSTGLRCACGGDACAYRLVVCWDVARPLGEGHIVVRHRGLDLGERHCLSTGACRVRNPHRSLQYLKTPRYPLP